MELEEAIKNIKEQIHNENGEHWNYIDIDNFYDDECENFICSIETVLNHLTKQEKMIQKIHENFCKFDWKNSNGEQVHNQLKELYESIFKNEESE